MATKSASRPKVRGVASAERLLRILGSYQYGDPPLKLSELTERTGLIKSTILRLTYSLEQRGFLVRLADGRFQLGAELFRLNAVYGASLDVESHVGPILAEVAQKTEETATFFIRQGSRRLCMFVRESPHLLRVVIRPGETRPMDDASAAEVLRAFDTVSGGRIPIGLPAYSAGPTDHTASMAVPVIGVAPMILGALAIHGPTARLTRSRAKDFADTLLDAGARLTRRFGGSFPY